MNDSGHFPARIHLELELCGELRYGENPHQPAARYRVTGGHGWWDNVVQVGGIALSALNLADAEAAWRLVHDLRPGPAAVIVKHGTPCGAAAAPDVLTAYVRAYEGDALSAFGGVLAVDRAVTPDVAGAIMERPKLDVTIAPGFDPDALVLLSARRRTRLLQAPPPGSFGLELRPVGGGFIAQLPDRIDSDPSTWRVVTRRQPTPRESADLWLAWAVAARTRSNAIVLVQGGQAVGIGSGQPSRVDASLTAVRKAGGRCQGAACASDGLVTFTDALEVVARAGATAFIQPGGSERSDKEVIGLADHLGLTMIFTGRRQFSH